MDALVLVGAVLGLYVVVALVIYGTRLGRPEDEDARPRPADTARRRRKSGWGHWL